MNTARWDRIVGFCIQFAGGRLEQQRQRDSGLTIHEFLRREVEERQRMRHDVAGATTFKRKDK